uniref:ARAD1D19294p n=1 Tax=Blastobotrys adeninivorans TaxID=409370 RepID=A0A060TF18_BLAAD
MAIKDTTKSNITKKSQRRRRKLPTLRFFQPNCEIKQRFLQPQYALTVFADGQSSPGTKTLPPIPSVTEELKEAISKLKIISDWNEAKKRDRPSRANTGSPPLKFSSFLAFKTYYGYGLHANQTEISSYLSAAWKSYPHKHIWDLYCDHFQLLERKEPFVEWLLKRTRSECPEENAQSVTNSDQCDSMSHSSNSLNDMHLIPENIPLENMEGQSISVEELLFSDTFDTAVNSDSLHTMDTAYDACINYDQSDSELYSSGLWQEFSSDLSSYYHEFLL